MYIFIDCNIVIHYTKKVQFLDSLTLGHVFEYFDGYIVNTWLLTDVILIGGCRNCMCYLNT